MPKGDNVNDEISQALNGLFGGFFVPLQKTPDGRFTFSQTTFLTPMLEPPFNSSQAAHPARTWETLPLRRNMGI